MVKVKKVVKTCEACPAQWEGITDDNRQVYMRYRWGCLSIRIGSQGDMSEFAAVHGEEILCVEHGDDFDGMLDYSELKNYSLALLSFQKVKAKILTGMPTMRAADKWRSLPSLTENLHPPPLAANASRSAPGR